MNNERANPPRADLRWQVSITLLLAGVVAACYFFVDRPAAVWARGLDPRVVAVFEGVTVLGSSAVYLTGLAALYPVLRYYQRRLAAARRALFVFVAIAVSGLSVNLLKGAAARWRPSALFEASAQYGFAFFEFGRPYTSFPSGHAATGLAVACAMSLLYPRLRALWVGAGVLVAASRVIIGQHFPGDVLAGAWCGAFITLALGRSAWFRAALEQPERSSRS